MAEIGTEFVVNIEDIKDWDRNNSQNAFISFGI